MGISMERHSQPFESRRKTRPGFIRAAAVILFIYAMIEVVDCVTVVFMTAGLTSNPYPPMLFPEMQRMFDSQPAWLLAVFLFFTLLRFASAVGLWNSWMWGFWTTIIVTAATLIMAPFLLPLAAVEMLGNGILLLVLLMGFFGDTPISG